MLIKVALMFFLIKKLFLEIYRGSKIKKKWKLMGMKNLSSGNSNISINDSLNYIKKLKLIKFVVIGSGNLLNIKKNIEVLRL